MSQAFIIDSHQHFWQLSRGDYGWLTPQLTDLYRDYLPSDLHPLLKELNISGTILIQAAPTIAETHFLLELAQKHDFILGVVGWVDLETKQAISEIEALKDNPYFLGIRPMLQDIPNIHWILKPELVSCFKALETWNITFDALVLPQHLPNLIDFAKRHLYLKIVIDHGAKPFIKDQVIEPWASHIRTLSRFPNVYCKFSGLITEVGPSCSLQDLQPYIDHLFECFGPQKIMWGSDFPVLNLASNYHDWFLFSYDYVSRHGQKAINSVFGETARDFYWSRPN